jgi:hypothetical protein
MNRKIAAIMAADIAGYSKLVAEDEEETIEQNRLWGPGRGDRISLELGNAGLKLIGKRR